MQFRPAAGVVGGPEVFSFRVTDNGTTGGAADPKSLDQSLQIQVTGSNPSPIVLQLQVAAGSDDAEERPWGGVPLASTDLDMTLDSTYQQTVGLRFTGVTIPRGSTIQHASIQFQADETSSDATSLSIRGQAADQAPTFSNTDLNITSRPRTSTAVTWNPAPWLVKGQAGPDQQTPNLAAVIQEIVNRSGWASGNALVIIIDGQGKRVAEAFEGSAAGAPKLRIEYLAAVPAPLAAMAAALVFAETEPSDVGLAHESRTSSPLSDKTVAADERRLAKRERIVHELDSRESSDLHRQEWTPLWLTSRLLDDLANRPAREVFRGPLSADHVEDWFKIMGSQENRRQPRSVRLD
jgi:hypothetical protein